MLGSAHMPCQGHLPLWLLTTWPGGAAWCRAALGRGLVVVWLYERPGLAFPYPLRVAPHTVFTRGLVAFLCCNFEASSERSFAAANQMGLLR